MTPLEIYVAVKLAEREASDDLYSQARKARNKAHIAKLAELGISEQDFAKVESDAIAELNQIGGMVTRNGYRFEIETTRHIATPASVAKYWSEDRLAVHKERE